jgi:hypothetical protein
MPGWWAVSMFNTPAMRDHCNHWPWCPKQIQSLKFKIWRQILKFWILFKSSYSSSDSPKTNNATIHSSSTSSRRVWVNPNPYTCGYNPCGGACSKPNLSRVGAKPSGSNFPLENPICGVGSNPILPTTLDDPTLVEVHAANLTCLGLKLNLVEVQQFPIGKPYLWSWIQPSRSSNPTWRCQQRRWLKQQAQVKDTYQW